MKLIKMISFEEVKHLFFLFSQNEFV